MQHTTNYDLPQWEATDAVKREDVNGAMATVDAALKGLDSAIAAASPQLVKLWEHTTTAAETTQIDVDVSNFALGDYVLLFLIVQGRIETNAKGISLYVDNSTDGYGPNNDRMAYGGESTLTILYTRPSDTTLHAIVYELPRLTRSSYGVYLRSYADISTINVAATSGSGPFLAGSRATLWGVKH